MKSIWITIFLVGVMASANAQTWTKVYENDAEGQAVYGSLKELINDVREGLPIRVAWGTPDRIEHTADAKFMTIMKGEIVFAQIDPIFGQTPDLDEEFIELKEGLKWVLIAASNGKSDAMMSEMGTGKVVGHNRRQRAFKWYVRKN